MQAEKIEDWLETYISNLLGVAGAEVSRSAGFDEIGLDSLTGVALIGDLEEWLGVELNPSIAYDFPSITALAQHISRFPELAALSQTEGAGVLP